MLGKFHILFILRKNWLNFRSRYADSTKSLNTPLKMVNSKANNTKITTPSPISNPDVTFDLVSSLAWTRSDGVLGAKSNGLVD